MTKIAAKIGGDIAMLGETKLFSRLSRRAAGTLLSHATCWDYSARDTIFYEGEKAQFFYCLLWGYVRLYKTNEAGRVADIRICEPKDTFAECMLRAGPNYAYSAQAAENAIVARFDLDQVRRLADDDRSVDTAVMEILAGHLLSTMECIADDRFHTAPQRLAAYLLKTCPGQKPAASFRLPFRKSLLAAKLGLTPEALSRAFALLKDHGVCVQGRTIRVDDLELLRGL